MKVIDPNLDGITHINVYSGSKTELGRMLSNFCREEIYTKDGRFMSVEAYWFWLGISPDCKERECMRDLFGYQAKAKGTYLREVYPGEQIEFSGQNHSGDMVQSQKTCRFIFAGI